MRNADGNAVFLRAVQRVDHQRAVVRMEDLIFGMLGKELRHIRHVVFIAAVARRNEQAAAECADLFVIIAGVRLILQKVKLHEIAVHVPIEVHQHRFDAAAIHIADRL